MYSHILVPVVFEHGNRGETALKLAKRLLQEGGKITLLNVIEEIPSYASTYLPDGMLKQHREEAMTNLQKLADGAGTTCGTAVIHGHASSSILDYAKEHAADCIIVASHKPGFEDYFLGSTAARVVRHATSAVHIMR